VLLEIIDSVGNFLFLIFSLYDCQPALKAELASKEMIKDGLSCLLKNQLGLLRK